MAALRVKRREDEGRVGWIAGIAAFVISWAGSAVVPTVAQTSACAATQDMSQGIATLRSVARRVALDVVVTDSDNRPVTGLTQDDFQVEEDGKRQPLRSFDAHRVTSHDAAPQGVKLPPNTFLNVPNVTNSGSQIVILYDLLNGSSRYSREQFLSFVQQHRTNGPVAIFALSNKLYLIQGFTEELSRDELDIALQRVAEEGRRNPAASVYGGTGYVYQIAVATSNAFAEIGRFLSNAPGRKNVIWYSSGILENYLPGSRVAPNGYYNPNAPKLETERFLPPPYLEQIKHAIDELTLSHVAVYPVDVRGVSAGAPRSNLALNMFFNDVNVARHASMDTFAEATGGHAFYGTNDLEGAIEQAIVDGSTYYSLTYEPTNPKYDGSLRHIKVTLKKPGYNLSYRKTYYADDLNAVARAGEGASASPLTPALERGTPLDHGLLVEAHLDTGGSPIPATPEQMKALGQYEAMRDGNSGGKKPAAETAPPVKMQQYVVTYALVAHQLEMPASDSGNRKASLEFGVMAYDEEGRKLTGIDTRIDDPISAERYAKLLAAGYRVQQPISIPASAKTLRLAVHDITGNRTGSLEIPLPLAKPAVVGNPGR